MIYKFFRILANIGIRVFYGKIEVLGFEKIPQNGPMLIACNHPNGFIEPIVIACLFKRPLHFMVRGDMFKKKLLKPILTSTNQIPINRFRDGFSELRKNDSNLKLAYDALDKNAAIILFIEGSTEDIKTLRPFQKGLSRMAQGYLSKGGNENLKILPVSINFISQQIWRTRVMLNIDDPIDAKSYFSNDEPEAHQVKKLTNDLYKKMLPLVFHVTQNERQNALDQTLSLGSGFKAFTSFPMIDYKTSTWSYFKKISDRINTMSEEIFHSFEQELNHNFPNSKPTMRKVYKERISFLFAIILLVPAIIGLIFNGVPALIAKQIAIKKAIGDSSVFQASVMLSSGVALYFMYYFLLCSLACFFCGWKGLLVLIGIPLGIIYLLWQNSMRNSFLKSKFTFNKNQMEEITSLFNQYEILDNQI